MRATVCHHDTGRLTHALGQKLKRSTTLFYHGLEYCKWEYKMADHEKWIQKRGAVVEESQRVIASIM
jgi:hypothetical protein